MKYKKHTPPLDFGLDAAVAHTTLAQLLPADGVLGPDPASAALGLALLGQLWRGDPAVTGLGLAPCALGGRADL